MEESRAEDEDEDEDDGDFNPDAMDEVGGEEEDDEETAELRQSGFFNDTAEQNEEDEYEDADEQAEMESDTDAELPKDNTVSPARIQRRLIQNESSFISDTTTLSPSQAPPQLVTKPVLDFGNGAGDEGGFSQFFDADEFSTQPPVADADGKPDNAGGLFQQQPVANMGGIGQLTKFPNFFVSQRERERNYDQLEEQAGFVAAAQDGAGLDQGPKMQFLNSQGCFSRSNVIIES